MLTKKRRGGLLKHDAPETEYWVSYSDLMTSLLMVFALALFAAIADYSTKAAETEEQTKKLKQALAGQSEKATQIMGQRRRIAVALQNQFAASGNSNFDIDPESGTIHFKGQVLFAEDSFALTDAGKRELTVLSNGLLQVLLGNEDNRRNLDEIIVEGHTNDNGDYMHNLQLSQERAFSVMHFMIENAGTFEAPLKQLVTANGRSFSRLIRMPDGSVDKDRSRRIEIRFRLKEDQMLRELLKEIEQAQKG